MKALHIVLVEPEIHWNTGNVGRTSIAVEAELHLVAPLGFSLGDKEVRRAGLDYWPLVKLNLWPDWATLEARLPELGQPYFFTAGAGRSFWEPRYPDRVALVFGRESVGLPAPLLAAHAGSTVSIPMGGAPAGIEGNIRSLNVSTAAALGAYEVRRQWICG